MDEKSQVQALDRSQPVLPMMPGMPERRTHDYARYGVTSLFAAFNIADGTVISELPRLGGSSRGWRRPEAPPPVPRPGSAAARHESRRTGTVRKTMAASSSGGT